MELPNEARSCVLCVLVPAADPRRPDPSDLVAACGRRLGRTSVTVWADGMDEIDIATVERAAMTADLLEALTRRRPHYQEVCGDLRPALGRVSGREGAPMVVALATGAPRSIARSVRRAARSDGAHVAFVPTACGPARELMIR